MNPAAVARPARYKFPRSRDRGPIEADGGVRIGETAFEFIPEGAGAGEGYSNWAALSDDGGVVAFLSTASNLTPGGDPPFTDTFAHDLQTGVTVRVSESVTGHEGVGSSFRSAISGDGRFVAFGSIAPNLALGASQEVNVYVKDLLTSTLALVSGTTVGEVGDHISGLPDISPDGRFVSFASHRLNGWEPGLAQLIAGSLPPAQIYLRDRGQTERAGGWREEGFVSSSVHDREEALPTPIATLVHDLNCEVARYGA